MRDCVCLSLCMCICVRMRFCVRVCACACACACSRGIACVVCAPCMCWMHTVGACAGVHRFQPCSLHHTFCCIDNNRQATQTTADKQPTLRPMNPVDATPATRCAALNTASELHRMCSYWVGARKDCADRFFTSAAHRNATSGRGEVVEEGTLRGRRATSGPFQT